MRKALIIVFIFASVVALSTEKKKKAAKKGGKSVKEESKPVKRVDKIEQISKKISKLEKTKDKEITREENKIEKEDNKIYDKQNQIKYANREIMAYITKIRQLFNLANDNVLRQDVMAYKVNTMAVICCRLAMFKGLLLLEKTHQKKIIEQMNAGLLNVFLKRLLVGLKEQAKRGNPKSDQVFLKKLQKNVNKMLKLSCLIEFQL